MYNKTNIIGVINRDKFIDICVGDVLVIKYESRRGYWSIKKFSGICIAKKKKGLNTKIILRNVIDNVAVEYDFFLNSPDIVSLNKVHGSKIVKKSKSKLYFLRKKKLNNSKV